MDKPIDAYWEIALRELKLQLAGNGFDAYLAESAAAAGDVVLGEILPALAPKTVSWGGSATLVATGLYERLTASGDFAVMDPWDKSLSADEKYELRRRALLVDCYFTGTNAVTAEGCLVNLDMYGNRCGAITFGPKNVIVLVGRNKLVPDLERAMNRIKEYSAPVNAMRLDMKTPCAKTGYCMDCDSPQRICNVWTITEKCLPKGRIKVVLINEDLGL
ncbi:lactate utilization protein [Pseudodesulfovibrio pelocollis]|uniref:lactate utilization protein n=1 Tax=Pseudodesulfovibrio pelocollis TaxID=3051432 RepID=UPI00255B287F|nr:lactate utilization protein [Pseudodesulfovibrio sp. SB368]